MSLEEIKQLYQDIYIIISPPRCSSTSLARVFWEHSTIKYYSHEPYEETFHRNTAESTADSFLKKPVTVNDNESSGLIIKEMAFQVNAHFKEFIQITKHPLCFLIRDPRLSFKSRLEKFKMGKNKPTHPHVEAGWEDLKSQIHYCKENGLPHCIIDSTEYRNQPEKILGQMFEFMGLSFSDSMINWKSREDINLCNLGGEHIHLYERVLKSTGIEPANEEIPDLSEFPDEMRPLVESCLNLYNELLDDPNRIKA